MLTSGIVGTQIPVFLCPSDPTSQTASNNRGDFTDPGDPYILCGSTNYKGVSGSNWNAPDISPAGNPAYYNPGPTGNPDGSRHGDGIFWPRNNTNLRVSLLMITDGTSNTFMIGEDLMGSNRNLMWASANHSYGTTAIPLNRNNDGPDQFADHWANMLSFRSRHPNGANFGLADGSVRFVMNSIMQATYRALTRAGKEVLGTDW